MFTFKQDPYKQSRGQGILSLGRTSSRRMPQDLRLIFCPGVPQVWVHQWYQKCLKGS